MQFWEPPINMKTLAAMSLSKLSRKVLAPAKLNLFLFVTGKRSDGYHDLCTLFAKINLFDELIVEVGQGTGVVSMSCSATEVSGELSEGADNLCVKAARLFMDRFQADMMSRQACEPYFDISIHLDKHIPIGAGLGGGSSDAAAVLATLNEMTGKPFSMQELMEFGAQLGSDVPFFLLPHCAAIGTGRGTELRGCEIEPMWFLLVWPGFSISTKRVYEALVLTKQNKSPIFQALFSTNEIEWQNDLETAVMPAYPLLKELKVVLKELGAEQALLSGSGSTVYGVFSNKASVEAARHRIATHPFFQQDILRQQRIFVVNTTG